MRGTVWLAVLAPLFLADLAMAEGAGISERLDVRITQSGFAGVTGSILTVSPDGNWQAQRFLNEDVSEPHVSGQLSDDQLGVLNGMVQERGLTSRTLEGPVVNQSTIEVQYGARNWTVQLEPDEEIGGDCIECDDGCAIVKLTVWLRDQLGVSD